MIAIIYKEHPVIFGWAATLKLLGVPCELWMPSGKPWNDVVDEINPDLTVGLGESDLDVPHFQLRDIIRSNTAQYNRGKYQEEKSCDVLLVSTFNREYGHIFEDLVRTGLEVKIIGDIRVPSPEYIGQTTLKETCDFIASAKVCLDTHQEILWDCPFNGGFAVSFCDNPLYPKIKNLSDLSEILQSKTESSKAKKKVKKLGATYLHDALELLKIYRREFVEKCEEEIEKL